MGPIKNAMINQAFFVLGGAIAQTDVSELFPLIATVEIIHIMEARVKLILRGLRTTSWRTVIIAAVLTLLQVLVLVGFGLLGAFH